MKYSTTQSSLMHRLLPCGTVLPKCYLDPDITPRQSICGPWAASLRKCPTALPFSPVYRSISITNLFRRLRDRPNLPYIQNTRDPKRDPLARSHLPPGLQNDFPPMEE